MIESRSAFDPVFLDASRTNRRFIDTVYAVLMAPDRTMEILCDANRHLPDRSNLLAASLIAIIASGIAASGLGQYMYFVTGLMAWFLTANLFCLASKIFGNRTTQFATAMIASAWAMLPWIFIGPLSCFKTLPHSHLPVGLLIFACISWSFVLQIIALKHCLGTNTARTIAIVTAAPFAIISGAIFWLAFIFITAADFL